MLVIAILVCVILVLGYYHYKVMNEMQKKIDLFDAIRAYVKTKNDYLAVVSSSTGSTYSDMFRKPTAQVNAMLNDPRARAEIEKYSQKVVEAAQPLGYREQQFYDLGLLSVYDWPR